MHTIRKRLLDRAYDELPAPAEVEGDTVHLSYDIPMSAPDPVATIEVTFTFRKNAHPKGWEHIHSRKLNWYR